MITCENCGCRVYSHGCVNCDEMEYISMQHDDAIIQETVTKILQQSAVMCLSFVGILNEAHAKCERCGREEWQHKL